MTVFLNQEGIVSDLALASQTNVRRGFIWRVSLIAGLGGILYGYDMGVIAAALIFVRKSFMLSTRMEEVVVSVVLIGAMFGALAGGSITDRIGRRATLLWGGAIFLAGSLLAPASPNVATLIVARVLLGVAIGFTSVTAPVYVSELSPPRSRGMLIGLYQFALTLGIALADLVGYWLASQHAWRLMFGIGALPAALFILLLLTLPESPRWLFAQNRIAEAESVLSTYTDCRRRKVAACGYSFCPGNKTGTPLERALEPRSAHVAFHRRWLHHPATGHGHQCHPLLRATDIFPRRHYVEQERNLRNVAGGHHQCAGDDYRSRAGRSSGP